MQLNLLEYFYLGALKHHPGKIAVEDGDDRVTFEELDEHSTRLALRICESIDVRSSPVAVYLPKASSTIVANLAILKSGNCYTNLDVKSPVQRVKSILENVRPAVLITSASQLMAIEGMGVTGIEVILVDAKPGSEFDKGELERRLSATIDTDPSCIINTSGSTGIPKSVVMNHRSVIDFMDWLFGRFAFGPNERIGSLSPFYFDIYTLELWYCLAIGATLVIIPESYAIFPVKMVDFLKDENISFIFWVPTVMVNIANQDLLSAVLPESMRHVLFAGEVFPTKHLNYWRKMLPSASFINLYGPIEITVDCTYFVVDRDFADEEPIPIGFPCRNTDVLILNELDRPAATGEQGELCVRGSSLAMGYWNDPEKTKKAFVQNPLNAKYPEIIYRTGDVVHLNENGEIMFDGRKDFQIKHQGYRIELGEIEHVLLASLNEIDNACVLYNKEKKEITLFYESKASISPGTIRQRLNSILPKYMLPTVFHCLDAMPRNPNGKIDRQFLQEGMRS